MDRWSLIDFVLAFGFSVAAGSACLGAAFALHAKSVIPSGDIFLFVSGKRAELLVFWGKSFLISTGAVLTFMLMEDWQFAIGALSIVLLSIQLLFRLHWVDAARAYPTYAVFELMVLFTSHQQLRMDY